MTDQEVPAPDALEQAQPVAADAVRAAPVFVEPTLDPEVPEADALEQAIVEPVDEEDELR